MKQKWWVWVSQESLDSAPKSQGSRDLDTVAAGRVGFLQINSKSQTKKKILLGVEGLVAQASTDWKFRAPQMWSPIVSGYNTNLADFKLVKLLHLSKYK